MGGLTYNEAEKLMDRHRKIKQKSAYDALMLHPNFKLAKVPELNTGTKTETLKVVDFVIESVANFVSPPKVDNENDELSCNDIANVIRKNLRQEIIKTLLSGKTFDVRESRGNVSKFSDEDKEAMQLIHEAAELLRNESEREKINE